MSQISFQLAHNRTSTPAGPNSSGSRRSSWCYSGKRCEDRDRGAAAPSSSASRDLPSDDRFANNHQRMDTPPPDAAEKRQDPLIEEEEEDEEQQGLRQQRQGKQHEEEEEERQRRQRQQQQQQQKHREKEKERQRKQKERQQRQRQTDQKSEKQSQSGDERKDFSYLKEGLTADASQDLEDAQGREKELQTLEHILQDTQELVKQLAGQGKANEDQSNETCTDEVSACSEGEGEGEGGYCARSRTVKTTDRPPQVTKQDVHRLKRCVAQMGCMVAHLRCNRAPPMVARRRQEGDTAPSGCCPAGFSFHRRCPHAGRQMEGARDRLSDLRNLYEHSLLMTPADVRWPFVHLIASNRQSKFADKPDQEEPED